MFNGLLDPGTQALLAAGSGLLSASGPQRMPVSMGQAMGQGLLSGMGAYQNAQQMQMAQQFQQMKMDAVKRQQQAEEERKNLLQQYAQGLPENERAAFLLNPNEFLKPRKMEVGPGGQVFDPYRTAPGTVLTKPTKMEVGPGGQVYDPYNVRPGTVLSNPNNLMQIGHNGEFLPNRALIAAKKEIAEAGKASVNASPTVVVQKGDEKYVSERRKQQAEGFRELEKSAESAYKQLDTLDRFIAASRNGTAGGAQPVISGVQNFLASFGYEPSALKDVRVMEQAIGDILGNKMAELGARGLTDKDMEILRQALPRVNTDAQSRVAIAQILKKSATNTLNEYANARAEEERIYPEFANKTPIQAWFKDWRKRSTGGWEVVK